MKDDAPPERDTMTDAEDQPTGQSPGAQDARGWQLDEAARLRTVAAHDIESLRETSLALIRARKEHPSDKKDLLNGMLRGVDPETGEKMTVGTL